eukprot:TRINITY_DN1953_c0_g1_i5.p1 TRINITY_DN1953_c0_g1~~TRINITY_DN1953_c0_g1_i5.p1  ORF type:complete len:422 (-),score=128.43 TRINITY_DN1953_c0_g1_i5:252-1472(-)
MLRSLVGSEMCIRDRIGMTIPEQQNVFDAFQQANSRISQRYGGSGLGLDIVRDSLKQLGGTIRVASVKNKGSKFTFDLPVRIPIDSTVATKPFSNSLVGAETPSRVQQHGVLVVDDDDMVRQVLHEQLSSCLGCKVSEASNGQTGLEQAGVERFAIILMDVNMPVLGGLEATQRIRDGGGLNATTPIVGLSANVLAADVQAARAVGMDAYLTKPYTLSELSRIILKLTDPEGSSTESDEAQEVEAVVRCKPVARSNGLGLGPKESLCAVVPVAKPLAPHGGRDVKPVLVVDDEVGVRDVLVDMISIVAPELIITQLDHGQAAVELSRETEFGLIFTDLHIPGMDGIEMVAAIRSGSANMDTPVVLVSGTAVSSHIETAMEAGMDSFLPKPFTIQDVENHLIRYQLV